MTSRSLDRLLVAGAAGFIGSNFVRLIRSTRPEVQVTVLDKLTYAGNLANLVEFEGQPGYRFFHGDICDTDLVNSLAAGADAIVNFAAETHVDRSLMDPFSFIETDVRGTAVLCEAARTHHHKVFLLVSTDEVYGDVAGGRSREDDGFKPRSPYSASKAGGEHLARAYAESFGLPLLVTRGSNNYGPYQYPEKLIPLTILNSLSGDSIPVYGDGRNVRNWLYAEDFCRGVETALQRGVAGEVYNCGGPDECENLELVRRVLALTGGDLSLIELVPDRPGHDRRYSLASDKLRALGWAPDTMLEQGLERTVRWYRENRWWWEGARSADYRDYYRRHYGRTLGA